MKRNFVILAFIIIITAFSGQAGALQPVTVQSSIHSVKLFTNKAEITRISKIKLHKGLNIIQIDGLPDNLYDWSARGSLPEKYSGKILSMEISRQALIEKRKKKIMEIEKKLEELKDRDADLADDLNNIIHQETFLNSIGEFTKQTASKELVTRLPQTDVWSNTMQFTGSKRKELQNLKRVIMKKRRDLAAEIQKCEFDLTQIAGHSYYSNYKSLKMAVEKNTAMNQVQQYGDFTEQYAEKQRYLTDTSQIDTEKRILLNIFSSSDGETDFTFTYMIPNTYWMMKYDFRASKKNNEIEILVYSDIYQKTGEDWDNISLSLSTGAPLTSIALPLLNPWYLSARTAYKSGAIGGMVKSKTYKADIEEGAAGMSDYDSPKKEAIPETSVTSSGLNFEISFPLKQSLESSEKYQKKFIKSYTVKTSKGLKYFFQTVPASSGKVFLMAKMINQTDLPWLGGEAQVFLENEFIGKVSVPDTPVGKEKELVLGIVPDSAAKKELVKKFDDTAGVFGGSKRVIYTYKIIVENNSKETRDVLVVDNFPVSTNEDIKVEIKNLSFGFLSDEEIKKSTEYAQGIRKYPVTLAPGAKKEITYDVVITYDKELIINGLK